MAGAPQQQPSGDNSLAPLWITISLFVAAAVIWYSAQAYIVSFVLHVRYWELSLIRFFSPAAAQALMNQIQGIAPQNFGQISFAWIHALSTAVGRFIIYPVMGFSFICALLVYFNNKTLKYRNTYNMQRLVSEESVNWPQILPVVPLDLVKQSIDEGPWAMALTPLQFSKSHGIFYEEHITSSDSERLAGDREVVLRVVREGARRVFMLQLSRYWAGVEAMPIHAQALFAIFAARIAGDTPPARKLLLQIASSAGGGSKQIDFSGTRELLAKHSNNNLIARLVSWHAFDLTMMASMLSLARMDGVVASAEFLWLKPIDRPLWYMLNSVGRRTPYIEVAGPFAHWLTEMQMRKRILVPMVDNAVDALDVALREIRYNPEGIDSTARWMKGSS